jgi:hypothetical protein
LTAVGIALLLCLVIGLTQEPDSGTAASVGPPDIAGAMVGANHAKPLPNVRSVTALLALWQVFTPVLLALGLLARLVQGGLVRLVATESDADRRPSVPRSRARARRGPPALV